MRGKRPTIAFGILVFAAICLCSVACSAETDVTCSDTNFVHSFRDGSGGYQAYDFNRFRSEIDLKDSSGRLRLNTILDFESYLSRPLIKSDAYQLLKDPDPDLPFNPYLDVFESDDALGRLYLYRLNAEAEWEDNRMTLGLQRIPFGTGRLWNPTDTFNPIDALSIEPEERMGVFAAQYTRYLSAFSSLQIISSLKRKGAFDKAGFRYKGHHFGMDLGFSFIENSDFLMSGFELASNLLQTGIEVRSELGIFHDDNRDETYPSGVVGLEYAFPANVTLLGEYFYNGLGSGEKEDYNTRALIHGNWNLGRHYLGTMATCDLNSLTTVAVSAVYNILDGSIFTGPSVSYSVNDETTISLGANVFTGRDDSEFGSYYDNFFYAEYETFF